MFKLQRNIAKVSRNPRNDTLCDSYVVGTHTCRCSIFYCNRDLWFANFSALLSCGNEDWNCTRSRKNYGSRLRNGLFPRVTFPTDNAIGTEALRQRCISTWRNVRPNRKIDATFEFFTGADSESRRNSTCGFSCELRNEVRQIFIVYCDCIVVSVGCAAASVDPIAPTTVCK